MYIYYSALFFYFKKKFFGTFLLNILTIFFFPKML